MVNKKSTGLDIKGALSSLEDSAKGNNINTNIDTEKNISGEVSTNMNDSINTNDNIDTNTKFVLRKKSDDKKDKKAFNVYMQPDLIKELDKLSKKSGYSRNELINLMCDYCVKNLELIEE